MSAVRRPTPLACCLLAGLTACHSSPPPDPAAPRDVVDLERFAVSKDGRRLGSVVHREIRDPRAPVRYYMVENATGQWLGYVDAQGRVFRFEPFHAQERFLGIYTMDTGLGLLYDVDAPVRITAEPDGSRLREASAPRPR